MSSVSVGSPRVSRACSGHCWRRGPVAWCWWDSESRSSRDQSAETRPPTRARRWCRSCGPGGDGFDLLGIADQHVQAGLLGMDVHEQRAGHRLDHCVPGPDQPATRGLATIGCPAAPPRRPRPRRRLRTDVKLLAARGQASTQHVSPPPRLAATVDTLNVSPRRRSLHHSPKRARARGALLSLEGPVPAG
jgi:hypothetical protein